MNQPSLFASYALSCIFPFVPSFPGGSAGKESARNAGDLGSIPGLGRSPGEENGYPLQYSGLQNSMDYSMGSKRTETVVTVTDSNNIGRDKAKVNDSLFPTLLPKLYKITRVILK